MNKTILKIYNPEHQLINTFELDELSALKALSNILLARNNGHKKDHKIEYFYNKQGQKEIFATCLYYCNGGGKLTHIYQYHFCSDHLKSLTF